MSFQCGGGGCSCSETRWGPSCSHCWTSCLSWPSCSRSDPARCQLSFLSTSSCSAPRLRSTGMFLSEASDDYIKEWVMCPGPTVVSAFRLNALLPLLFHLLRGSVINVGLALREQLLTQFQDDGEMVAGVGELVWTDLKHGNIFQNHLRKEKVMSGNVFNIARLKAFIPTCLFLPSQSPPFPSQGWCHQSA